FTGLGAARLFDRGRTAGAELDAAAQRLRRACARARRLPRGERRRRALRDAWDEDFLYGIETYDAGLSTFAQYYATTEPPVFLGGQTAVSAGVVGWPEDVLAAGRDLRDGGFLRARWLLVATPTLVDPSRAPDGHHTVKFLGMAPWNDGDWPPSLRDEVAIENLAAVRR